VPPDAEVEVEYRTEGGFVLDVGVLHGGKEILALEVHHSNLMSEKKRDLLACEWLEIDASIILDSVPHEFPKKIRTKSLAFHAPCDCPVEPPRKLPKISEVFDLSKSVARPRRNHRLRPRVAHLISGAHLPDGPFLYSRPVPDGRMIEHWLSLGDIELTNLRDGYLLYGMLFRKLVPYVQDLLEEGCRVIAVPPTKPGAGHATIRDEKWR